MDIVKSLRKPFHVEAVRVTRDNLEEVREWCNGTLEKDDKNRDYIHVEVKHPLNPKQEQAYVGDWVLLSASGFKVYTNSAYRNNFDEDTSVGAQVGNVFENAKSVLKGVGVGANPVALKDAIAAKRPQA
jgi:hypothetical protein